MVGCLAAVLLVGSGERAAAGEPVATVQAEGFKVVRGSGGRYSESSARERRALQLRGRAVARRQLYAEAADELVVRVRRGRCAPAPRLSVRVDGRPALDARVGSRRWTLLRGRAALAAGPHELEVSVARRAAPGRCRPDVRLDEIVIERSRGTVGPGPVPGPDPPTQTPPLTLPRTVGLGTALQWDLVRSEPRYRETFLREFTSLTPENEFKWLFVQPQRGRFDFEKTDAMVDFARANGKTVRGHTLVWSQQLPSWVSGGRWTRAQLLAVMERHISTVVGRYKGRVAEWDVINEPLAADGSLARNVWLDVIGPDYLEHALRFAHAADPGAKLFVNEIAAELVSTKSEGLVRLAADLVARGAPLHGIGLQNHANLAGYPSRERLATLMRRFAALGLEVQITEMDVGTVLGSGNRLQRLDRQAEIYRQAAAACNEVPACTRLTTWGFTDRHSWIGERERALPFDAEYLPKPAFVALRETLLPRG